MNEVKEYIIGAALIVACGLGIAAAQPVGADSPEISGRGISYDSDGVGTISTEPPAVTLNENVKFYFCPYQADEAEADILSMLFAGHTSVRGNAYGFTDAAVCDALIKAKEAGVDV